MAATERVKRRSPDPDAVNNEPVPEAPSPSGEADGFGVKRPKLAPVEPSVVRRQVEYYLSDENLRYDKFFHEKISADPGGWLDISLILGCNKMKAIRATREDVVAALRASKLELQDDGQSVRRPGNAPLPKLEAKPQQHHAKKSSLHAHDGGPIIVVRGVSPGLCSAIVKEGLQGKLPDKVVIWHASEVDDKGQCIVVTSPFVGDLALFRNLELDLGGARATCDVSCDEELQQAVRDLPKQVREKRDKVAKLRQKERNRPIVVGCQRFVNVGALRSRVKEILNSCAEGELLKPGGADFELIRALLEFHPSGAEKGRGLGGIKVAKSAYGDTRCFYLVKTDGSEDDVSLKKCVDAVDLNPPYAVQSPLDERRVDDAGKPIAVKSAEECADRAEGPTDAAATLPQEQHL